MQCMFVSRQFVSGFLIDKALGQKVLEKRRHIAMARTWVVVTKHLVTKHNTLYEDAAQKYKWKRSMSPDAQAKPVVREGTPVREYSYELFVHYLIRFIVTDDQVSIAPLDFCLSLSSQTQSLHVVECPKLCDICWLL